MFNYPPVPVPVQVPISAPDLLTETLKISAVSLTLPFFSVGAFANVNLLVSLSVADIDK